MSSDDKPDIHKWLGIGDHKAPEPVDSEPTDREWVEEQLDPVAGDKQICTLTEEQIEQFVHLSIAEFDHMEMQEETGKRIELIRQEAAQEASDMIDYHKRLQTAKVFRNAAEGEEAFRLYHEWEMRSATFWYSIRAQCGVWGDFLAVRRGWIVVSVGKKYKL
jgi:hypothetical protein